jgi:hypothetical protein
MEMENKEPVRSPFKAPEGYFEGFEQRLKEKLGNRKEERVHMHVTHKKRLAWSAAASILLLGAAAFWYLLPVERVIDNKTIVDTRSTEYLLPEAIVAETSEEKKAALVEAEVLSQVIETPVQAVSNDGIDAQDNALAAELEEEGLIDLAIEDGLFEEIEI